jgi:hypothetical protein
LLSITTCNIFVNIRKVINSLTVNQNRKRKKTPSLYGNTTRVIITTDDIWLPYVYLVNSADDLEPLGHDADSYAYVTSTGFVYWNPGGVMKAKCRTDISKFPFDVLSSFRTTPFLRILSEV